MRKASELLKLTEVSQKFPMETEEDYEAFLAGKILYLADNVSYNRYKEAERFVSEFHQASELEEYLTDLLSEIEALKLWRILK